MSFTYVELPDNAKDFGDKKLLSRSSVAVANEKIEVRLSRELFPR